MAAELPLFAGPRLLSSDVQFYVAIGELVDTGGDPRTRRWRAISRPGW